MESTITQAFPQDDLSKSNERLQFTVFLALAINAILILGVGFSIDVGEKMAPTLNLTLATHKSADEPEKADFVAQNNQQASGTEDDIKELTTVSPAEIADINIHEVNPEPKIKAQQYVEAETKLITSTLNPVDKTADIQLNDNANEEELIDGDEFDSPAVNLEIASLRAKLDRLKQDLARQPRIRRLTSVSAKASYDAAYLNMWAQKIEGVGNKHYPQTALRRGIFGQLRLSVLLDSNGGVENVEILQSSGHSVLDNAAIQIVKLASPFPPFPKEIRQNTDQLEIIRTWRFEITGLSTIN